VLSQDLTQAHRTMEIELCSTYFVIDNQARELVVLHQSQKALKQKHLKENKEWADLVMSEAKKWQTKLSYCRNNLKHNPLPHNHLDSTLHHFHNLTSHISVPVNKHETNLSLHLKLLPAHSINNTKFSPSMQKEKSNHKSRFPSISHNHPQPEFQVLLLYCNSFVICL
jgi:hypothetical protein